MNKIVLNKEREKVLRKYFSNYIKQNFLIKVLNKVLCELKGDIFNYYDAYIDPEKIVTNDMVSPDYEICKMIVGIHRSNTLFFSEEQLAKIQNDDKYIEKLVQAVIIHIKIRGYAVGYFRNRPIIAGEEYIFYPVPYKLFVLGINANKLLIDNNEKGNKIDLRDFYIKLFNKAITSLTLLENNMLDSAYPICRAIIEIFYKLLLIENVPGLLNEYNIFIDYDLDRIKNKGKYTDDFIKKFNSRRNTKEKRKSNYLYFGWVDIIEDYHEIVKNAPYSIEGLNTYLCYHNFPYSSLIKFYKKCNPYTHGIAGNSDETLMDYFDVTTILGFVIPGAYELLCKHVKCDSLVCGIDVLSIVCEEIKNMLLQKKEATQII